VAVARDAVAFLRGKQSADVELLEEYPEGPVPIRGDRGQLIQVITNILNNAYEAQDGHGRIRLVVRAPEGAAELEVIDAGPGIPAEVLPLVFEPFFTTKGEGKGTGLGLAICHGIIRSHHGSIIARNAPGGGASFLIALPQATEATGPKAPPNP
jgi:signal transduction histidine kinase